ncbi:MAG: LytTR family transcriptional regulator DNA-binding domain-containing protein, partial [Bacteroidota bacterium]
FRKRDDAFRRLLTAFFHLPGQLVFLTNGGGVSLELLRESGLKFVKEPFKPAQIQTMIEEVLKECKGRYVEPDPVKNPMIAKFQPPCVILFAASNKLQITPVYHIEYLDGTEIYVHFGFTDGSRMLQMKYLKAYREQFEAYGFMRVSRHFFINMLNVSSYHWEEGRQMGDITMQSGAIIPLSRRVKDEFVAAFEAQKQKNDEK